MDDSEHILAPEQLLAELGWLRALAHRLVSDPNVADDVLQRVCLVALEKPPTTVSGAAGLRRWLSTLTRRTAAHTRRADRRRTRREQSVARTEALPSTADDAERREALHQVVDALGGLPSAEQQLLRARYFEGLSIPELAEQLELSDAAVRQRLSRARQRLRTRLESEAGLQPRTDPDRDQGRDRGRNRGRNRGRDQDPDRQRWLAALAPVAPLGLSTGQLPMPVPRASLPLDAAQTALSSPLGVVAMTKLASIVSVKLVVTLGLVTAVAVTTWQVLETGEAPTPATTTPIQALAAPVPEPRELPMVREQPAAGSVTMQLPAPEPAADPPTDAAAAAVDVDEAPPSDLALLLEHATASYLTGEPDLQALNEALRQLALAAVVDPETVAKNPKDGSVSGWVEIEGTDLEGEWTVDADGRYSVGFDMLPGEAFPEHFIARDLSLKFTADGTHATDVDTMVQFHPNTSEANMQSLLASLDGQGETHVGWHLRVGPQGTIGSPISMSRYQEQDSVIITASGGLPTLSEAWANDTSPYDLWLSLFAGYGP